MRNEGWGMSGNAVEDSINERPKAQGLGSARLRTGVLVGAPEAKKGEGG